MIIENSNRENFENCQDMDSLMDNEIVEEEEEELADLEVAAVEAINTGRFI